MKKKADIQEISLSTEEKIKESARKVFMQKGYSATRTRDIAEASGINLALLNYYFRSKENLFNLVMLESMQQFLSGIKIVLNNEGLSLEEKIEEIVKHYTTLFQSQPDLPMFVLSEIRQNPERLANKLNLKRTFTESHFFKQLKTRTSSKLNPMQILINIIGLTVFPFIAGPLLMHIGGMENKAFEKMMLERKTLIPVWIKEMLGSEEWGVKSEK